MQRSGRSTIGGLSGEYRKARISANRQPFLGADDRLWYRRSAMRAGPSDRELSGQKLYGAGFDCRKFTALVSI
jgi:hypothetical protein